MKILGGILLALGFYAPIFAFIHVLSDNMWQTVKYFLFVFGFTMSISVGVCLITGFI